jgi:hypothetical protein
VDAEDGQGEVLSLYCSGTVLQSLGGMRTRNSAPHSPRRLPT